MEKNGREEKWRRQMEEKANGREVEKANGREVEKTNGRGEDKWEKKRCRGRESNKTKRRKNGGIAEGDVETWSKKNKQKERSNNG